MERNIDTNLQSMDNHECFNMHKTANTWYVAQLNISLDDFRVALKKSIGFYQHQCLHPICYMW